MIEMLAVMALMLALMAIGIVGFLDFKKDAAIRTSTLSVKTGISQARQVAITYRKSAYFRYGNTEKPNMPCVFDAYYVVSTNTTRGDVSQTNWMAEGIVFGTPGNAQVRGFEDSIRFKYDGGARWTNSVSPHQKQILIVDRERQKAEVDFGTENTMTNVLVVTKLTGLCRIVEPKYSDSEE